MFQNKSFSASLLFIAVSLLVQSDPVYASINQCSAVFNQTALNSRSLTPIESQLLQIIVRQREVLTAMSDSLDPVTVGEYFRFLDKYTVYIQKSSRPEIAQKTAAILQQQLDNMIAASNEIRGKFSYPKEELNEKINERQKIMNDLTASERAWLQYSLLQSEIANAEKAKKANGKDGKALVNTDRKIRQLSSQIPEIKRQLVAELQPSPMEAEEKLLLLAFLSDRSLETITSLILEKQSVAVHISPETRQNLVKADSKDAAFSVFVSHLRERHRARLQVKINVTPQTHINVAFRYYLQIFGTEAFESFSPHALILDVDLREQSLSTERQLRAVEKDQTKNRKLLSTLWHTRETLIDRIHALENYLDYSTGTMGAHTGRATTITGLNRLFQDLQTVEDNIGLLLPTLSLSERNTLLRQGGLTESRLLLLFDQNIQRLHARMKQLREEGRNWLLNRANDTNSGEVRNDDDDIELF